jgi:hypothetical protein
MKQTYSILIAVSSLLLPAATATAQPQAQDVVTVGSSTAQGGTTITIPVYIRDTSGTPLGIDQPAGNRIQSYSITVNYSPASAVQSITFTRAGITAGLTPVFESSPSGPGSVSLVDTFQESTNLIPFTLNAPAPGNQIGKLTIALSPNASSGALPLTLDPVLTQLSNEGGTVKETTTLGNLQLVSGTVTILAQGTANVPTVQTTLLVLLAVALAAVAVRLRL